MQSQQSASSKHVLHCLFSKLDVHSKVFLTRPSVFSKRWSKRGMNLVISLLKCTRRHVCQMALHLAHCMGKEGIRPNHVTFVGVLTACSHGGLMDEGFFHFYLINQGYEFKPVTEHYVCMVDLLGRAGRLEEAEFYVKELICKPEAMAWRALLSACRNLGDMERAECVLDCIVELLPEDEGAFVLLSNIYGASGVEDEYCVNKATSCAM
ncbi:hypothetical protein GOP47_0029097 [Adiantum capillus-veneris]|nr:hypothetical protein GOP47_0029097 [Adiantum capillus-veneris]